MIQLPQDYMDAFCDELKTTFGRDPRPIAGESTIEVMIVAECVQTNKPLHQSAAILAGFACRQTQDLTSRPISGAIDALRLMSDFRAPVAWAIILGQTMLKLMPGGSTKG